jgi:hypothetical protein
MPFGTEKIQESLSYICAAHHIIDNKWVDFCCFTGYICLPTLSKFAKQGYGQVSPAQVCKGKVMENEACLAAKGLRKSDTKIPGSRRGALYEKNQILL